MSKPPSLYTPEFKRSVRATVNEWRDRMHLHGWEIELYFSSRDQKERIFADVSTEWPHKWISITLYPDILRYDVEKTIIHELTHSILEKLSDCANNLRQGQLVTSKQIEEAEEDVCSHISAIIYGLLEEFRDKESPSP